MTDTKKTGGPAFPQNDLSAYNMGPEGIGDGTGMTLRDWFAAQAPEMTEQWFQDTLADGGHWLEARASWSYAYADAMLEAREEANG